MAHVNSCHFSLVLRRTRKKFHSRPCDHQCAVAWCSHVWIKQLWLQHVWMFACADLTRCECLQFTCERIFLKRCPSVNVMSNGINAIQNQCDHIQDAMCVSSTMCGRCSNVLECQRRESQWTLMFSICTNGLMFCNLWCAMFSNCVHLVQLAFVHAFSLVHTCHWCFAGSWHVN